MDSASASDRTCRSAEATRAHARAAGRDRNAWACPSTPSRRAARAGAWSRRWIRRAHQIGHVGLLKQLARTREPQAEIEMRGRVLQRRAEEPLELAPGHADGFGERIRSDMSVC